MEAISNLIRRRILSAVFIFLFSFVLFSPSLTNDFVWDDVEVISKSQVSFEASDIINVIVPPVDNNKRARYYRTGRPRDGFNMQRITTPATAGHIITWVWFLILGASSGAHRRAIERPRTT